MSRRIFESEWGIGDVAYSRLDGSRGVIVNVIFTPGDCVLYRVAWGVGHECNHYGVELSAARPADLDEDGEGEGVGA